MIIGSANNFEEKTLSIDGLDTTKHLSQLDEFRKKGWFLFRSSPDARSGKFLYRLKRPMVKINKEINA